MIVRTREFFSQNRLLYFLLAGLLFTIFVQSQAAYGAEGRTYYVAPNGNDGRSGSEAQPLKTIQKAVYLAQAGDTIYVRAGTYHEEVRVATSGTANRPLRLLAYPGETPVIDGEYTLPGGPPDGCSNVAPGHCFVYKPLVSIEGSHVEFRGFKVIRSYGRGIGVKSPSGSRTSNVLIDECIVRDIRSAAIHVLRSSYVTVQNCDVSHGANFATHSRRASELNWPVVVNMVGSDHVTVRRSKIYESWGEGIAAGRDSTNIVIEDNIIYDNYALQAYLHRSQDVTLQRNLIYHTNAQAFRRGNNPSSCIVVNNESYFPNSLLTARIKIRNNVVTGCSQGIAIWGNAGTDVLTRDVEITHNTVVHARRNTDSFATGIAVSGRATLKNIVIKQNIALQDNGRAAYIPNHTEVNVSNNLWSSTPLGGYSGSGDQIGAPSLTSPNQPLRPGEVDIEWFMPTANSPAVALGAGPYEYLNQPDSSLVPTPTPIAVGPTPTAVPGSSTVPEPEVLFHFNEGGGRIVHDVSNHGNRIDLTIQDSSAVRWSRSGLTIVNPVVIRSQGSTSRMFNACRSTNALSIDAWITPANSSQDGPARIVSFSNDPENRNFTLGQGRWGNAPSDVYNMRLRTSRTDNNGEPALISSIGAVVSQQTHLSYSRNHLGEARLYVNGEEVAAGTMEGQFSNWKNTFPLLLANEATGDRPWLGTYHSLAIYCEPLTAAHVRSLYQSQRQRILALGLPDDVDASVVQNTDWGVSDMSPAESLFGANVYLPIINQ
ncbi:MAG: right-handed parallel beta-helix repeat-containing protein [Chloroflexota bacterium]